MAVVKILKPLRQPDMDETRFVLIPRRVPLGPQRFVRSWQFGVGNYDWIKLENLVSGFSDVWTGPEKTVSEFYYVEARPQSFVSDARQTFLGNL